MGRAGILPENARVELIEGVIIENAPTGKAEQTAIDRLNRLFQTHVGGRVIVRIKGPLRLADTTELQPDIQLLERRDDFYLDAHPTQATALLVIEVADTSLEYDRDENSVVYARRGVQELWVIDIVNQQVLVMRGPSDDGYRDVEVLEGARSVAPIALPDLLLTATELLGPSS